MSVERSKPGDILSNGLKVVLSTVKSGSFERHPDDFQACYGGRFAVSEQDIVLDEFELACQQAAKMSSLEKQISPNGKTIGVITFNEARNLTGLIALEKAELLLEAEKKTGGLISCGAKDSLIYCGKENGELFFIPETKDQARYMVNQAVKTGEVTFILAFATAVPSKHNGGYEQGVGYHNEQLFLRDNITEQQIEDYLQTNLWQYVCGGINYTEGADEIFCRQPLNDENRQIMRGFPPADKWLSLKSSLSERINSRVDHTEFPVGLHRSPPAPPTYLPYVRR